MSYIVFLSPPFIFFEIIFFIIAEWSIYYYEFGEEKV